MGRVLSGVQPTGNLHLGNYLGAIKNWCDIQFDHECLFCIVDLHAITVPQEPEALRQATRQVAAAYIACGIDPSKNVIFNQSMVSAHAELAWILSCETPIGWLNRMTQFKDKAGKNKEKASTGLYTYPVLMAADILAYKATLVPVGEDQKQHLELARDIAGGFNRHYNVNFFPIPEPFILKSAARIMSLRDGTQKMSKSDPSDFSRINLTDDSDTIVQKIKKAKSDMLPGVTYDPENRPEASNLLDIYSVLSGEARETIEERFSTSGFAAFKQSLAEVLVASLTPIRKKMLDLLGDTSYIDKILGEGAEKANALAGKHLDEVKDLVGFLRPGSTKIEAERLTKDKQKQGVA